MLFRKESGNAFQPLRAVAVRQVGDGLRNSVGGREAAKKDCAIASPATAHGWHAHRWPMSLDRKMRLQLLTPTLLRVVLALVVSAPGVIAQPVPGAAAPAAQTSAAEPAPTDPLGRSTPRGTVLGFLTAARNGENELARQYLGHPARRKIGRGSRPPAVRLLRRRPAG